VSFPDFLKAGLYLRNWSPKTVRAYEQAYTSFQQSPGVSGCSSLSKTQLETWVVHMRKNGMSPGGANCYIRAINSYLSWLHEERGHHKLRLKLLKNPRKPVAVFSDADIRLLLAFKPKGHHRRTLALVTFLLDSGCRIDEGITLKRSNTDLDNLLVTVVGKGSKERKVPISLEGRRNLFRHIQRTTIQSPYVFCTRNGTALSYRNAYKDIKRMCKAAGIEGPQVHPHATRHYFSVTYIRRGGDLYRLSRILGHSSVTTTQIYLSSMGVEVVAENHSSLTPLHVR
jgi:integrase/recombinase XerD